MSSTLAQAAAEEWAAEQMARFAIPKGDAEYVLATLVAAHLWEHNADELKAHISTINEKIEITVSGYEKRWSVSNFTKNFLVKSRDPLLGHLADAYIKPGEKTIIFYLEKVKLSTTGAPSSSAAVPKKLPTAYGRKRVE